ncbi:MAG: hypothetical protein O3B45_07315 [Bacteroidetes bacterium]|jgi:hypothetical protein|nr:hypothetical protein [Bacteroidota bacterium]
MEGFADQKRNHTASLRGLGIRWDAATLCYVLLARAFHGEPFESAELQCTPLTMVFFFCFSKFL